MSAYTKPDVSQLDIDKTFFYGFRTKFLDKTFQNQIFVRHSVLHLGQHSLTYHFITIRYLLDIQGNLNNDNIPQSDIGYTFYYAFKVAFLQ